MQEVQLKKQTYKNNSCYNTQAIKVVTLKL